MYTIGETVIFCITMAGKRNSFISGDVFEKKVLEDKPKDIINWADLPLNEIFKVNKVKDINVNIDGEEKISQVAELENQTGDVTNVWLTTVGKEKLGRISDFNNRRIFIRSLGLKDNKKQNRKYYDCDVVEN